MTRFSMSVVGVVAVLVGSWTPTARAIDEAHRARARAMAAKAIDYLKAQQDTDSGGWAHNPQGPNLPAISGLVLTGMLMDPAVEPGDPAVVRGASYVLGFRQPDGGIYDRILPSYNTAICLSALARLDTPEANAAIGPAQDLLRGMQYSERAAVLGETGEPTRRVGPEHPFYGGIGYGSHGRPDNSNLSMMLQGLHDSGVPSDDPSFQRALVFLQRTQMADSVNDMPYADGSSQGGFIYATSPESDQMGQGESKAGTLDETLDDGTRVSRLRAYGSMTYAGFKSYLYAGLDRDDERVRLALAWIERSYTLDENPGVGLNGMYYYFVTFARALAAADLTTIHARTADGTADDRDWANDLIDRLGELQQPDGSFAILDSRWMEDNPVLITAYGLIALEHALGRE